ncbi:alpha-amylase family glycosyl hydrolase [Parvularcula marina]|uniref:alpha-amylase family glycosyl hydrolase n=1 Tax=Parvularcula marina TaxID=2292771 RepID=UPI003511C8E9
MMKSLLGGMAALSLFAAPAMAGPYDPAPYVKFEHADWAKDAVLYQINTRQFTKEGTFDAAREHLPRLAEMGVDILWLMPVHPIGEKNRKGGLGSPYSVKDYRGVNPEFGTVEDLKEFVDAAHELGMHVILDWVANHSSWDNHLVTEHPEWYYHTPEGEFSSTPGTDWSDIIDFDYSQPGLRKYMTESLVYWVRDVGIDGYRADVAGFVPLDFWENARAELEEVKPVFMLAEWEQRDMHQRAFDATYAWSWKEAMQKIAEEGGTGPLNSFYYEDTNSWPDDAYRMVYTSNHDQNSWDGVASEIYGDSYEAAIVMSFVGEGLPLIYNGQEADLGHQLEFFEKDEIIWDKGQYADLFRKLISLKHETKALWNGGAGAPILRVPNDHPDTVFSFMRAGDEDKIFAVFNLSDETATVSFSKARHHGNYRDAFTGRRARIGEATSFELGPWGYRVFRTEN